VFFARYSLLCRNPCQPQSCYEKLKETLIFRTETVVCYMGLLLKIRAGTVFLRYPVVLPGFI
jgi:hypothetical protein